MHGLLAILAIGNKPAVFGSGEGEALSLLALMIKHRLWRLPLCVTTAGRHVTAVPASYEARGVQQYPRTSVAAVLQVEL